jgi:hypothetical protein
MIISTRIILSLTLYLLSSSIVMAQSPPPANVVIEYLSIAHFRASSCGRPTAPIEQTLDRYFVKSGTGQLEADRLRRRMMSNVDFLRGRVHIDCSTVDKDIADAVTTAQQRGGF